MAGCVETTLDIGVVFSPHTLERLKSLVCDSYFQRVEVWEVPSLSIRNNPMLTLRWWAMCCQGGFLTKKEHWDAVQRIPMFS